MAQEASAASPIVETASVVAERKKAGRRRPRALPTIREWPMWLFAVLQALIVVGFLLLWELAARFRLIDPFFWSQPSAIYQTMLKFFASGDAWVDIAFTFRSTLLGFFFGTVGGISVGLSFWWSRNFAKLVQPYLICIESIPKLALAPLIILVFGMDLMSKVVLATALTFVVSTISVYAGVRALDQDRERLFYSLGATRWQVFTKLVGPSCVPWMISLLRVNIGLALSGAIVGEYVASQHGLGRTILYAGASYDIALVWVAVLVLSTLSMVLYALVAWLESILLRVMPY